jgi:hypothetical protein
MIERGRHRAPGRHARPKSKQGPIVALAITAALIFGVGFNGIAYSIDFKAEPVAVDATALIQDEAAFVDVKELDPNVLFVAAEVEIPYEVSETQDPQMAQGTRVVQQPGTTGEAVVTYAVRVLNGVEVARTEVSRSVNRDPIPEVAIAGSGDPNTIANQLKKAEVGIKSIEQSKIFTELYIKATYSWGADQFQCIDKLWEKESNWRYTADNPTSSAYGIPQSLPGSRMASIASDWETNPATQIKWGAQYISERYTTPCAAYEKALTRGWY